MTNDSFSRQRIDERRGRVRSREWIEVIKSGRIISPRCVPSFAKVRHIGTENLVVQDRVTDHRIGLTMTGLDSVLEGEGLESVMRQLKEHQRSLRMESLLETGEDLDE